MDEKKVSHLNVAEKKQTDVRAVLLEMLERADDFDVVMIIAETSNGPMIRSSTSSNYQKAWLSQFFLAWSSKWMSQGMADG